MIRKDLERTKTNNWKWPEHFASPRDDFSMHIPYWNEIFSKSGLKGKNDLNFLELGTAQGRSCVWLLENILTGENSFIDTVDKYRFGWYEIGIDKIHVYENKTDAVSEVVLLDCAENLKPYIDANNCKFHHCNTVEFFRSNSKTYHFIYIDASHYPDDVFLDAQNSFNCLLTNGIIIFDDYKWGNCSIGIDKFLDLHKNEFWLVGKGWQIVIQKK